MATSSAKLKVGDYTVDVSDHIGRGATGVVHPATDAEGKDVAAKRICGEDNRSMAKISRDLHKLTQLSHPNIVKFYNIKHQKSEIWLFMEYCTHKDLHKYFRKNKLNKHQTFVIMGQMTRGVEYLHSNDVIHRDIKPSNILVKSNDPIWIKLTDFDFSKFLEEDRATSLMTTNVGTPAFKAPEFYLRNSQRKIHYHRNVDTYALGLTFLAMIQEQEGLVPRIETPTHDSELYAPIGRVIAERIKYEKEPLDVIPEHQENGSLSVWFSQLTIEASSSAATDLAETVTDAATLMKNLIRRMTNHEPKNRPSAAQVVADLDKIGEMMGYLPESLHSAFQEVEDEMETNFEVSVRPFVSALKLFSSLVNHWRI